MISLITPTGGRPEAFQLCCHWMSTQTFSEEVQWIVVDDCDPPTSAAAAKINTFRSDCHWFIDFLYPNPLWTPGMNTQGRNLESALSIAKGDIIFFIEDDDYYAPEYLEQMLVPFANGALVVGESRAKYYHIPSRRCLVHKNDKHASLCQTAIHKNQIPLMLEVIRGGDRFFDMTFWEAVRGRSVPHYLFPESRYVIGIKGLPGRGGIGNGHQPPFYWPFDRSTLEILRKWTTDEAAEMYRPFVTEWEINK